MAELVFAGVAGYAVPAAGVGGNEEDDLVVRNIRDVTCIIERYTSRYNMQ